MKTGLIGVGFMGSTHLEVYKRLSSEIDVQLLAIADIREEKGLPAARGQGAKYYATAEELILDPEIEAVDICVPTFLHAKYACMAMEQGKHVFVEKPVALTPEEGRKMLEVQKKTGRQAMAGQCIRMWPAYVYLKGLYDSGKYGGLKSLALYRLSTVPQWSWENWYQDLNRSGGALMDLHVHDVDFMRYLLGEPDTVYAAGNREHVFAEFTYAGSENKPNRTVVHIEGSWDAPASFPFAMGYRATFQDAAVTYQNGTVMVYAGDGRRFTACVENDPEGDFTRTVEDLGAYYTELKYFYQCLLNGEEIQAAPLCEGVKSIELVAREAEAGGFYV